MVPKKYLILFSILLSMVGTKALAYDIAVENTDGVTIYYNYINDGKELEVTSGKSYAGVVVIPEEVTYMSRTRKVRNIGVNAFADCGDLTSVTIPGSVTSIGKFAFYRCYGLTSVDIPNSVTSIGEGAFYRCMGLISITIPNGVTTIEDYTFKWCCDGLTSITIPNSVTSIGREAFYGCLSLTSVTIPNSVTSIGGHAFSDCSALPSIEIPNSVTCIENSAFLNCSSLTYFTVDDTNTKYKSVDGVLLSKDGTALIAYPAGNTETSYSIPNSVTSIENLAFLNCSSLTSVTIPSSVTSIGEDAFYACTGLTSIEIPNSVTSIGAYAFYGCSGLTSVTIPSSVTSIGEGAFSYCRSLTSITVDDTNTKYKSVDGVLLSKDGTVLIAYPAGNTETSYNIPNSVTSIGGHAFYECSGLTSIEIPNSVTSIGGVAFYACTGLTSIEIPNSVTSIGEGAFYGCSGLTSITTKIENPFDIVFSTFSDKTYSKGTLYVPAGTIDKYKATEGWKKFANIEEGNGGGDTPPEQSKCEKPTISYQNGKLIFSCATEGVTYQYNITASSIKSGEGNDVDFTPKYSITAYATKDGYKNSDTATLEISVSGGVNGDINGDGFVNAADVVKLVNIIMGQ